MELRASINFYSVEVNIVVNYAVHDEINVIQTQCDRLNELNPFNITQIIKSLIDEPQPVLFT